MSEQFIKNIFTDQLKFNNRIIIKFYRIFFLHIKMLINVVLLVGGRLYFKIIQILIWIFNHPVQPLKIIFVNHVMCRGGMSYGMCCTECVENIDGKKNFWYAVTSNYENF